MASKQFDGRTVLVTGAGRGIGAAISRAFAENGAKVVLSARSEDQLTEVADAIRGAGGEAASIRVDLSDRQQTLDLIPRAREKFGPIDILVNNAGIGSSSDPRAFVDYQDEFWDLTMAVNLDAPYILSKAVIPHMMGQSWGRIITVASTNSRHPNLHATAYTASKHGLIGLMRSIALEVSHYGVTVNCICPGPVKTLMNNLRVQYDTERLGRNVDEYEKEMTLVGGRLVPEDIAPLAIFLASNAARMITGQGYNVDGGVHMP